MSHVSFKGGIPTIIGYLKPPLTSFSGSSKLTAEKEPVKQREKAAKLAHSRPMTTLKQANAAPVQWADPVDSVRAAATTIDAAVAVAQVRVHQI